KPWAAADAPPTARRRQRHGYKNAGRADTLSENTTHGDLWHDSPIERRSLATGEEGLSARWERSQPSPPAGRSARRCEAPAMSTIIDVARKAGVSKSTVSRGLTGGPVSPETKARVLEAMRALNYQPNVTARGLVGKGSRLIGVLVSDVMDPYYSEL